MDGGGSGTRTAITDAYGRVLARGAAGASNPHRVGVDGAAAAIEAAVAAALKALPADWCAAAPDSATVAFAGIAVGLAGRSHPQAPEVLRVALADWQATPLRLLVDDGELARAAVFGASDGVLLAAGTGSAAWGRGPAGEHRCGGLGPSVGDAGSGHALGMAALRAAAACWDAGGVLPAWLSSQVPASPRSWERQLRDGTLRAHELAPFLVAAALGAPPCEMARGLCAAAAADLAALAAACQARCGIHGGERSVATSGSVALALKPWLDPLLGYAAVHVADALPGAFALLQAARGRNVPPGW